MITTNELKSTATRDLSDNLIRKAWVLQSPDTLKKSFAALPQEVRFELYRGIDGQVRDGWVSRMKSYKESLLEQGVKMVFDPITGVETLPSVHLIETEEFLISAAADVVNELVASATPRKAVKC